jgi:type II restriction enzyme
MYGERGKSMQYHDHLTSYQSLITPYEKIRSGFIALALEKNRKATPYVEEAKVLKVIKKPYIDL